MNRKSVLKKHNNKKIILKILFLAVMIILGFSKIILHKNKQYADTTGDWKLILVDKHHYIPKDYQVNLIRLSNGKQVDSRIYSSLQKMFNDARASGLSLFVREGYRTSQDQQQIMNERIREYENQGYSKRRASKMAEKYVAIPGTRQNVHQKKYTAGLITMHINMDLSNVIHPANLILQGSTMSHGITDMLEKKRRQQSKNRICVWKNI